MAIPDKFVFKLQKNAWLMEWRIPEMNELLRRLKNNKVRITSSKEVIFTDIILIGKATDLKGEMERHFAKSDKKIEALKKKVIPSFAYVLEEEAEPADKEYLNEFKEKTEGIPPVGHEASLPLKMPKKLLGYKKIL